MPKIKVAATKVKQGRLTLYTTFLKVSDLLSENFYSIERLDPNKQNAGYQRVLNEAHAKKLAKYIISGLDAGDSFIPTSIFMATDKELKFHPEDNTLEIDIDEIGSFSIVDGQHRAEGLRIATTEDKRVKDFEVPVNIAVSLDIVIMLEKSQKKPPHPYGAPLLGGELKHHIAAVLTLFPSLEGWRAATGWFFFKHNDYSLAQMTHFLIVNTTQKSVDNGVSQQIYSRLTDTLMTEELPTIPDWIMRAVEKGDDGKALSFVHYMNIDNSPWFGKIKMANDEDASGTISQASAVNAIKKYILVANNPLLTQDTKIQNKIFSNYWQAITDLINPSDRTTLYKYAGFEQFSQFFVPFVTHILNKHGQNLTIIIMKNTLKEVFDNLEGDGVDIGTSEFWDIGGQAGKYNAGGRSKITKDMVQVLARTLINLKSAVKSTVK